MPVDRAIPHATVLVVDGVLGSDQLALKPRLQLGERGWVKAGCARGARTHCLLLLFRETCGRDSTKSSDRVAGRRDHIPRAAELSGGLAEHLVWATVPDVVV